MDAELLSCGNLLSSQLEVETTVWRCASEAVYGNTERRATTPRLRYQGCDEKQSGLPEHPARRVGPPRSGGRGGGFSRNRRKVPIQSILHHSRYRSAAQRRRRYCAAGVCQGLRIHPEFRFPKLAHHLDLQNHRERVFRLHAKEEGAQVGV